MKILCVCRKYFVSLLIIPTLILITGFSLLTVPQRHAQASSSVIKQISHDPFTNSSSQHQTQVEPDTLSFGPIVVSTFQSGRFYSGGGSSGISWATSLNAGITWTTGTLPG